jgi:cytochrome c-type biogenesis protein CcmH/NrfG
MKKKEKNKDVSSSEPSIKIAGVSKEKVILIAVVSLLVGFILGATVAILKTSRQLMVAPTAQPMVAPTAKESEKNTSVNYEEEIRQAKSILEKDPNNLQALITLGNACFDTDRYQEAIDAYSRALAIDPKNPDVRTDMGIMYRKLGQFDKAIEAFRQTTRDNLMHVNSRFNLGVALKYDKNDYPGAIQAWEEFLKLEPYMEPDDGRIEMVKKKMEAMKAALLKK